LPLRLRCQVRLCLQTNLVCNAGFLLLLRHLDSCLPRCLCCLLLCFTGSLLILALLLSSLPLSLSYSFCLALTLLVRAVD
jgi:hypothetical protein